MKIRSLLLGSVAAAGLSTGGAYAADLGVLTSLDVCDELGLSGLTISSDTNCLQITGEVKYKFTWGDYRDSTDLATHVHYGYDDDTWDAGDGSEDWESRFDAWIKFVATANSDFGPAKAVLKLKEVSGKGYDITNESWTGGVTVIGSDSDGLFLDEAYVSIGDATVIMAGKKGSILKKGDDEPLNWLGLFFSDVIDKGVGWRDNSGIGDGGHVIQVVSDLGNGISVGAGLENLNDSDGYSEAGTAVGVISYAGDGISAHASFAAAGVLDGDIEAWGVHAGFAGTFDNFKVVLAGAYNDNGSDDPMWNVLASASATFDMFTIAGSVEAVSDGDDDGFGAGASLSAAVADGIKLNVGGRWWNQNHDDNIWQVAASVEAAVTESITLTGEVGYLSEDYHGDYDLFYGSAKLAWAPGGGYTSSIKGTINSAEAYKIETEFKKTFE